MTRADRVRSVSRSAILAAAAMTLAACAAPAPYRPAASATGTGFADQRIEANRYQVVFRGDSRTARQAVETFLLYRAAEVTVAAGGDYFRVVEQDTTANTRYFGTTLVPYGYAPFHYRSFGGLAATSSLRPITRYEAVANIVVFAGEKPAGDLRAYDARDVLTSLGPSIQRPAPR